MTLEIGESTQVGCSGQSKEGATDSRDLVLDRSERKLSEMLDDGLSTLHRLLLPGQHGAVPVEGSKVLAVGIEGLSAPKYRKVRNTTGRISFTFELA